VVTRILIWSLYESKTTLEELRARLPELGPRDAWIVNEAQDRFGLVSFDDLPDLRAVTALIGRDPDVAEEFDLLE
jgi:hypothetical protein